VAAFLWRAHAQSGFTESLGECNAIKSWGFGERDLTFELNVKTALQRFPQARFWTTGNQ
jgi:hypothetical protein